MVAWCWCTMKLHQGARESAMNCDHFPKNWQLFTAQNESYSLKVFWRWRVCFRPCNSDCEFNSFAHNCSYWQTHQQLKSNKVFSYIKNTSSTYQMALFGADASPPLYSSSPIYCNWSHYCHSYAKFCVKEPIRECLNKYLWILLQWYQATDFVTEVISISNRYFGTNFEIAQVCSFCPMTQTPSKLEKNI